MIASAKQNHGSVQSALRWLLEKRELGLTIFLLAVVALASAFVPAFGTIRNARDILSNQALLFIGALGATVVIIAGGIDISVGAILGLSAMIAGKADQANSSVLMIAVLPLVLGLAIGIWNGVLTVLGRVHSIVITLGMMFILRGLMLQIMGNRWLFNLSTHVTQFGQSHIAGIPVVVLAAGICFVALHWFLRYSVSGRNLYALGGDTASACLLGVRPLRSVTLAFGVGGLLVGLAGLLHAGMYGQVQTNVGQGYELKVIAAAVIGGTHIMGGRGTAFGTLLGAVFLGVLSNLLVLMQVSAYWDNAVVGAMILLAIAADAWITHARKARP
jgi:ribose/xylose/arabinose/galactoside ABC-type transport system permease subunit